MTSAICLQIVIFHRHASLMRPGRLPLTCPYQNIKKVDIHLYKNLVEKVKELQHLVVSEVRQKKALQVVEQELSAEVRKKHRRFRCCCCNGLIAIFILLLAMGYQYWSACTGQNHLQFKLHKLQSDLVKHQKNQLVSDQMLLAKGFNEKQLTAQLKETQSQLKLLQNMPLFERVFRR